LEVSELAKKTICNLCITGRLGLQEHKRLSFSKFSFVAFNIKDT
jgi:hypothetical protein